MAGLVACSRPNLTWLAFAGAWHNGTVFGRLCQVAEHSENAGHMPCREHTVEYEDGDKQRHHLSTVKHVLLPPASPAQRGGSNASSDAAARPAAEPGSRDGSEHSKRQKREPEKAGGQPTALGTATVAWSAAARPAALPAAKAEPQVLPRGPVVTAGAIMMASGTAAAGGSGAASLHAAHLVALPVKNEPAMPASPAAAAAGAAAGGMRPAPQMPDPHTPEVAQLLTNPANEGDLMPVAELLLDVAAWAGVPAVEVSIALAGVGGLGKLAHSSMLVAP